MIGAGIAGLALWGAGLDGWEASLDVLRGSSAYAPREAVLPPPAILPPNERRRSSAVVRLALHVADAAARASGIAPERLRPVFGSSNGDGAIVHSILEALAAAGDVSPTAFHNSVHNAAAGYWCIAQASRQPVTCLGAYDSTLAAALLKALADLHGVGEPVLLCVYDMPLPPPLDAKRPVAAPFAVAMVLVPGGGAHGRITAEYTLAPARDGWLPRAAALHDLARGNPAAQSLRLLEALARRVPDSVPLPYQENALMLHYTP